MSMIYSRALMRFGWLHVSDLHLQGDDNYDRDVVLRQLVSRVDQETRSGRVVHAIFVTGDIVSHGRAEGYESATRLLDKLCKSTGLHRRSVFVVPGNHDVQRDRGTFLVRTLSDREQSDAYFSPRQKQHHFERLERYQRWYDDYFDGIRSFPVNSTCGPAELLTVGEHRIGILPINSALFCRDEHDHEKLWVGRRCLDDALERLRALDTDLRFSIQHHPFGFLHSAERSLVERKVLSEVDLVLRGHLHENSAHSVCSSTSKALYLAAGAAYQGAARRKLAFFGQIDGIEARILPLRYFDDVERWHVDPTLFPTGREGCFPVERLASRIQGGRRAEAKREAANSSLADGLPVGSRGGDKKNDESSCTVRELGERTAASARGDEAALVALVEITGLSRGWVVRNLIRSHGRVRLRKVFSSRWPEGESEEDDLWGREDDADADADADKAMDAVVHELGDRTAASARDDEDAQAALVEITGLSMGWVRRHLNQAKGRVLLRNVFWSRWPDDDAEIDVDELGARTIASVRADDVAIRAIAQVCGVELREVELLMSACDGRRRVHGVFEESWPDDPQAGEDVDDDDVDDDDAYSLAELAEMTVASARDDDEVLELLCGYTGRARGTIKRALRRTDGRARLRGLFGAQWSIEDEGEDDDDAYEDDDDAYSLAELAEMTVASARDDDEVLELLCWHTGRAKGTIKRALRRTDGRARLKGLFGAQWSIEDEDESEEDGVVPDLAELGSMTTASARDDEAVLEALAELTEVSKHRVRARLQRKDGRYRLRTIFAKEWPHEDEDEDEDEDDEAYEGEQEPYTAEELASWTAASALKDEVALDSLTEVTGLPMQWVTRKLNEADGRVRVRNVFAKRWPSPGDEAEELAYTSVASAREDPKVLASLARITHITQRGLLKRLMAAHGRTYLSTLFADFWPE